MNSENNPPITIGHSETGNSFRMKDTIKNPNFFHLHKISKEYIANHSKKYLGFVIKCDFKLILNNDFLKPILIAKDFYNNFNLINLKRYLFYQIYNFIDKGHEFSHFDEMNITTVNNKMYMTYEY